MTFFDPRLVVSHLIEIKNDAMERKLGQAKFFSGTYRLFKLNGVEAAFEDYGIEAEWRSSRMPSSWTDICGNA